MGFRVLGLGFERLEGDILPGVWGLEFRVWGLGFRDLGFKVLGLGFRV